MKYVNLGTTDLQVSHVGFGCAGLGNEYGDMSDENATRAVSYAIERGVNYFDTSAYYGRGLSEERVGRALEGRRSEVVLATKGGRFDAPPETGFDFSYDGIIGMCEASLTRLRTDYIDIYQLHDIEFGDKTEVFEDAVRALVDLKTAGKVRCIGVTGYPLPLLIAAVEAFDLDSVLSYCRYNLMDRSAQRELIPVAQRRGTPVINASILHMGMLSDRGPQDWHPAPDHLKDAARRAVAYCTEIGISVSDLATQFAVANEDVAVTLLGSSKIETIRRSLDAAEQPLNDEHVSAFEAVLGSDNLNVAWTLGRPEHWEPSAPDREVVE